MSENKTLWQCPQCQRISSIPADKEQSSDCPECKRKILPKTRWSPIANGTYLPPISTVAFLIIFIGLELAFLGRLAFPARPDTVRTQTLATTVKKLPTPVVARIQPLPEVDEGMKTEAWMMAELFVTDRLDSPSTASFGRFFHGEYQDPSLCVAVLGNNEYRVTGWVESQNNLDITVRTDFVMRINSDDDGENWSLVGDPLMVQR